MKNCILFVLSKIPYIKIIVETRTSQTPVKIKHLLRYLLNKNIYWPIHSSSLVTSPNKISIGIDVSPGYMPGCYIQGGGGIEIGDYTQISCNVGLISRNHDMYDVSKHIDVDYPSISIGKYCWIGMNVTILPGVKIPNYCVIGAGSVVTKSVKECGSVLVGNPAKLIKKLNVNNVVEFKSEYEYVGFIKSKEFKNLMKET
jgi:acetyltransferase-like isoleucine patch superfamily enzyme